MAFDEKLRCAFCMHTFSDFGPLGAHVRLKHAEIRRAFTPKTNAEEDLMGSPREEGLPEPEANQDFAPWLSPEALGKNGTGTLTLLGTSREAVSQFGKGLILDVRLGNANYSWTVKFTSGNYARLFRRFGKNVKNWRGKVAVETKEYMGKDYVAVTDSK